jgi:hypothetical protein
LQPLSPVEIRELSHGPVASCDSDIDDHPDDVKITPISSLPSYTANPNKKFNYNRHSMGSIVGLKTKLSAMKKSKSVTISQRSDITQQTFWKYHILEIGDKYLYLTTNPDSKHLYCRNAPGVHVEIIYPESTGGTVKSHKSIRGFKLIFRDQLDDKVFMTVTVQTVQGENEIHLKSLRQFYKDESGNIVKIEERAENQSLVAYSKRISWRSYMQSDIESSVRPIRYELKDLFNHEWNVGSVPQFQTGTKLKNKRFIYFTNKGGVVMGCFRPHEQRIKKKIINQINKISSQNSERPKSYHYSHQDDGSLRGLGNIDDAYYSPSDGINEKNPIDDSPNDVKLGWITIIDDEMFFQTPGNWETVLGFNLAVGLIRVFDER